MKELIFAIPLIFSTVSYAANDSPRADAREFRQVSRIVQGVQAGSLTAPELHRLAHQQANIRQTERRIKSDGKVTAAEQARLEQKQNAASASIYRQKHDRQQRHW